MPTAGATLHPADVLRRNGGAAPIVGIACAQLGLTADGCDDGSDGDLDDVDGLSYGDDFEGTAPQGVGFSVGAGATGVPTLAFNDGVSGEAFCFPAEPQADEFYSFDVGHYQLYDGNGVACGANLAPGFGLVETAAGDPSSDDVDGLAETPPEPIATEGVPLLPVYFSLASTSPSLGRDQLDLYPMGVARVEGILVQATPQYTGPGDDLFAPGVPARALGPRAAATWLRERQAGHWRALTALSGCDRGAAPWGRRRTLTTAYQTLIGDGVMYPGGGPAPVRFRALIGLVGQRRDAGGTEYDAAVDVSVRLVVETVPPGTDEADGTAVVASLSAPSLALAPGPHWRPIRQALAALDLLAYGTTKWSSRGTMWPRGGDGGATVEDDRQITWVECEVVSAAGEHPRIVRPEIKATRAGPGVGTYVWWIGGCIVYRPEVTEALVYVPSGGDDYGWRVSNGDVRPTAAMGTSITPGINDAMGSWTALLAALAEDVYRIRVHVNSSAVAGQARPILIDIGVDPAGGTAYTVLLPTLSGACAGTMIDSLAVAHGGQVYDFEVRIPAGSTVAARAQVGNATASTVYVRVECFGLPRDPAAARAGTVVTAYGIDAANSRGTAVTPGTVAEGAWTQIGTIGAEEPWGWQCMASVDDSTMTAVDYTIDLAIGDASTKRIVIEEQWVHTSGSEVLSSPGHRCAHYDSQQGQIIYARAQCSGVADSNFTVAAWGVGP